MCKHILNAQVSIRAVCCKRWFDCPECHSEVSDHVLLKSDEITFICKKCRKAFRKNISSFEDESDEYCPHCDNHFLIQAITPKPALTIETEDIRKDNRVIKDHRERQHVNRSIFSNRNIN
ncbi:hypothetical protein MERGE_002230 [Pneumocystis wakefieldiae]|uniref:CHY-type domain-containing protein n=1 Tax=Pneumocystis wakefieldiae TaxID=38082 RepID=A0A899FWX8_9ASCO|nr:hypothetical protein MERGE_002230 [Pneumocystis wakefieldiae]